MSNVHKKQKLRVLHMPANIRWVLDATVKAENDLGIQTKKMLITPVGNRKDEDQRNIFIKPNFTGKRKSVSYVKYIFKTVCYFWHFTRLVLWADVVHWQYSTRMWDENKALSNYDFWLLKALRKPAIAQFHGSDLRDNDYWQTVVPWWPESYGEKNLKYFQLEAQKTQKRFAEADFCFAMGYGMFPFVWDENKSRSVIMERSIELRPQVQRGKAANKKVKIVHAPSNPSVKGTKYVLKAIENLREEFDFEFVLIENMEHDVVLDALEESDIVIDQLVAGDYGLFAVEGMNAGAATISNVTEILRKAYPADLPIIQADPDTIDEVLRTLLKNPDMRNYYAELGPAYAHRLHECHSALGNVLKAYLFAANHKHNKKAAKKIEYFLEKYKKENEISWGQHGQ